MLISRRQALITGMTAIALIIALQAFNKNLLYYYSPTQISGATKTKPDSSVASSAKRW